MTDERQIVNVHISGDGVTLEDAQEVAEATRDMLNAVQESMGLPANVEIVGDIQRMCDGCNKTVPANGELPVGWVSANGMDYCAECVIKGLAEV